MAVFGKSSKRGTAKPKGGYGASGKPADATRSTTDKKGVNSGPFGNRSKPKRYTGDEASNRGSAYKASKPAVTVGKVYADKNAGKYPGLMNVGIPKDQASGRFNLPKVKV